VSSYQKYLVDLVNSDPDYVVDVLDISAWELVHHFPSKVRQFIEEEYGVGPEDKGILSSDEEDAGYGDDEEEGWCDEDEEDDY